MKKVLFIIIAFISVVQVVTAQVKWMGIEEAMRKQDSMPKTVMIDMYTDWCGWCKKMDAETFSNPELAAYINANFYPVKFDAETTDTIMFPIKHTDEKTGEVTSELKPFINLQTGNRSPHLLAQMLLSGRMSYPTIVFIDFEGNVAPVPGYQTVENLEPLLVYFAERINKYSPWNEYMDCFNATFRPETDTTGRFEGSIDWMDFNAAVKKMKTEPKKLLLYIYSNWNTSSKIMLGGAFKEKALSEYINKNFYPVQIPYDITDSLVIAGRTFINETKQAQHPHQIVLSLLHPDYRIPAFVIFDENATHPMFVQRGFSSYSTIEKLLTYFGDDLQDKGVDLQKYYDEYTSKLRDKKQISNNNQISNSDNDVYSGNEIFKKCNSAVFTIYTSDGESGFQGSGFFISSDGVAVSNYHVFEGTLIGQEKIKLSNGNTYSISKVIAKNKEKDIIVFKVDGKGNQFNYLKKTTHKAMVGDKVYAIGSPYGLENTFSSGEISQFRGDDIIQISAPIDHGSSGGALINSYGEVIGITSFGIDKSGANLNFAIDIKVVNKYIDL